MRYGYATGFATTVKHRVNDALLDWIAQAGYDFVEFPLMLLATQPLEECRRVAARLTELNLGADSCCNMFPASLRLTGPERNWQQAKDYLRGAFERMALLGTSKVVFGSSGARNLPDSTSLEEGYRQVSDFVGEVVVPFLEQYQMRLAMEPIGHYEANFINTLDDGMQVVQAVNHPRVRLLADSVHMLYENEGTESLNRYAEHLEHIHLCEADRVLPVDGVSPGLEAILKKLRAIGYNGTASFEPMPYGVEDMKAALRNVKSALEQ